jgi:predicted outer membrane protein
MRSGLEPPAAVSTDGRIGVPLAQPLGAPAASVGATEVGDAPPQPAPGAGALAQLTGLDDASLAAVVVAIYQADVAHLQLALARGVTPAVLHFARDAIEDRWAQAAQDQSVLAELHVIPSPCAASDRMADEWRNDRALLAAARAPDFDHAFIDHHVGMDVRAVSVLDAVIAAARSPTLRAHLQSDRTSMAGHMRESQHLQQSLSVQTALSKSPAP